MAGMTAAGTKFWYACGTSASSTRPTTKGGTTGAGTTSFKEITGIASLPTVDGSTNTVDITPLSETIAHRYAKGLKDVSGDLEFTMIADSDAITGWNTMYTAAQTAISSGYPVWFAITPPSQMGKDFFFEGDPSELGFGGAEVDGRLDLAGHITLTKLLGWDTQLTDAT